MCLFDEDGHEVRHEADRAHPGHLARGAARDPRGQLYGFRADGPWEPDKGLVQPEQAAARPVRPRSVRRVRAPEPPIFGHARTDAGEDQRDVRDDRDSAAYAGKAVVVHDEFDWGGEPRSRGGGATPSIYELHVKGFTELHDRIPEELRGTYAGLGHPVVTGYLQELGVTAVELLPIHQFVSEAPLGGPGSATTGDTTRSDSSRPHSAYSSAGDRGEQVTEFKQMVKDLHRPASR